MYRLLIVDDEAWIRRGIRAKLKKHGFHFSWIGEAADGVVALGLIKEFRPDIVLADIKMDGMDGLELMSQAHKLRPNPKFIVISGHSDFAYAEHAINEGARGYILKPIESRLFVQRLQSVIIELDREGAREGFLEEVLSAHAISAQPNPSRIPAFDPSADLAGSDWYDISDESQTGSFVALGIIHIDSTNSKSWIMEVRAKETIRRRLATILTPALSRKGAPLYEDKRSTGNLIFLCSGSDPNQAQISIEEVARMAHATARPYVHSMTIGCSDADTGVTRALHAKARGALDRRLIEGTGAIYHYAEDHEFEPVEERDLRFLKQYIHHGNRSELRRHIHEILSKPRSGKNTVAFLHDAYASVVHTMISSIGETDPSGIGPVFSVLSDEDFDLFDDVKQIADNLYDAAERALCDGSGAVAGEDRIEPICRYIDHHFSLEISTQQLASEFNLNANYLSTLFRKKTGLTISAYITQARINAACRLLSETTMTVSETAETVGYFDPKYFHKVFKRTRGLTPGEFRRESLS